MMPPGGAAHRARRRDRPRRQMASEGPLPQDRSDDLLADDLRRDASRQATNLGPILRLRAYPGFSTVTIGGQPDPRAPREC